MLLLALLGIAPWQSAIVDMPGTWVADHRAPPTRVIADPPSGLSGPSASAPHCW